MSTSQASTHDSLVLISSAPTGYERSRLINDFIAARQGQFQRLAMMTCRRFYRSPEHVDDVTSIITEQAWKLLNLLVSDPAALLADSRNFDYVLRKKMFPAVQAYMHSELGGAAASGMSNVIRRAAQVEKTRNIIRLREMREATDSEIIEETNARLLADRVDAAKQGILVTKDDLYVYEPNAEINPELDAQSVLAPQMDFILLPTESKDLVGKILAAVHADPDESLGPIADQWIGSFLDESIGDLSQADLSRSLGMPRSTVARKIGAIRVIARKIVEAELDPEDYF